MYVYTPSTPALLPQQRQASVSDAGRSASSVWTHSFFLVQAMAGRSVSQTAARSSPSHNEHMKKDVKIQL